jgi:uncharacterized protein
MFLKEESFANFGLSKDHEKESSSKVSAILLRIGKSTYRFAPAIILVTAIVAVISLYGISKIEVNDNPVKWFSKKHPIRKADRVLNAHFGGTYMAYLTLIAEDGNKIAPGSLKDTVWIHLEKNKSRIAGNFKGADALFSEAEKIIDKKAAEAKILKNFVNTLTEEFYSKLDDADDDEADIWDEIISCVETIPELVPEFKRPEVLRYIARLQKALKKTGTVGKSNSVTDLVKKIYMELMEANKKYYKVPDTSNGIAQTLISFQSSHKPQELWHLVTTDYKMANIWVQLKSGDNRDMSKVIAAVDEFIEKNPPPASIKHKWFGLTYINVIWQEKMVFGMLQSFIGSFLVVFVMMLILYRSVLWGAIAMIPMTLTVSCIYGFIGFIGKDYDMPVAVLSSLTLGLAVDFGIHFLTRSRDLVSKSEGGNWENVKEQMFGEPARAITRNIFVIAVGFLPLLAAPLIPYKTVGFFLSAILGISGIATLIILPALVQIFSKYLFKEVKTPVSATCNCSLCALLSVSMVILVGLNAHQYLRVGWTKLGIISLILIPVLGIICGRLSRRNICKIMKKKEK